MGRNDIFAHEGCYVGRIQFLPTYHVWVEIYFYPCFYLVWPEALPTDFYPRCLPMQKNIDRGFAYTFLKINQRFFALAKTKILVVTTIPFLSLIGSQRIQTTDLLVTPIDL